MNGEANPHRLIERPPGIPGYLPRHWCAICGLKVADTSRALRCIEQGCPNLSHSGCLDGEPEYNCAHTRELRVRSGIRGQVTFSSRNSDHNLNLDKPVPFSEPAKEDDLSDLSREELKVLVINLREELLEKKQQTKVYCEAIDSLTEKRSVLVDALGLVDTLIALKVNSSDKTEPRSISCTAKPEKIDKSWAEHISDSAETREWWSVVSGGRSERGEDSPHSVPLLCSATQATQGTEGCVGEVSSSPPSPVVSQSPPSFSPIQIRDPPRDPPRDSPSPPARPSQTLPPRLQHRPRTARRNTKSNRKDNNKQHPHRRGRERTLREADRPVPEQPTRERPPQAACSVCHRKDHTAEKCPRRLICEYCQGRFHTVQTCRERQADKRHQNLIEAVRTGSQETQAILHGVAWRGPAQQIQNTWRTHLNPGFGPYIQHHPYPPSANFFPFPAFHGNASQWH